MFIDFFRQREERREREEERNIMGESNIRVPPIRALIRDRTGSLPVYGTALQPTEPLGPGL